MKRKKRTKGSENPTVKYLKPEGQRKKKKEEYGRPTA